MPSLRIRESGIEREVILGPRLSLGRLPENDLVLVDETISRHHAEIILSPDGYILKDLGTRNGTWVNGERIKEIRLKDGDEIKVGAVSMKFLSPQKSSIIYEPKDNWLTNPLTMIRPPTRPSFSGDQRKLEIIYNISQAINSIFDLKELMEKVAGLVLEVIRADRFLLMLKNEKSGEIVPELAIGRDRREVEIGISQTMVKRVLSEGISILVRKVAEDAGLREAPSIILQNTRSILCAPLQNQEGILGLIYADTHTEDLAFSEEELDLFTAIGHQVAVAFKNIRLQEKLWEKKRIERELELAARIQQSFLPQTFPACPHYEFAVKSLPAHNVGGDFYDCFAFSSGEIGLVMGDVSGKGIPAALYMARFLNEFRITALNFSKPHLLLSEMNKRLKEVVVPGTFVSAVYLMLAPAAGIINYALAGSPPPLLYQPKEKTIRELALTEGQILGIGAGSFSEEIVKLSAGDIVIIYTDGVIEARNKQKEEFGLPRLKEAILHGQKFSAGELIERIIGNIQLFTHGQEQSDDLTLCIFKKAP